MRRIESHHGAFLVYGTGGGKEGLLVQCDYDYPATAESLGWNLRRVQVGPDRETRVLQRAPNRGHGCAHSGTDGTVDCPDCGVNASEFIGAAGAYLDSKCW